MLSVMSRKLAVLFLSSAFLCGQDRLPQHGKRAATLEIKNAMVVRGDGSPAAGPQSVFVKDGLIVAEPIKSPEATIDANGGYVLPGLVSTHAHLHEEAESIPIATEYQLDLWL